MHPYLLLYKVNGGVLVRCALFLLHFAASMYLYDMDILKMQQGCIYAVRFKQRCRACLQYYYCLAYI